MSTDPKRQNVRGTEQEDNMQFRNLLSLRKKADVRVERPRSRSGIEQLEDRLCLGGLGSIPAPSGADFRSGASESDARTILSQVSYESTAETQHQPISVSYDFRDQFGFRNQISAEQQRTAELALKIWSEATNHRFTFVRDTESEDDTILNIGVGDLLALDH
jgi:hypothetical protein